MAVVPADNRRYRGRVLKDLRENLGARKFVFRSNLALHVYSQFLIHFQTSDLFVYPIQYASGDDDDR